MIRNLAVLFSLFAMYSLQASNGGGDEFDIIYGDEYELADTELVYIKAPSRKSWERITKELRKAQVVITQHLEEADTVLFYTDSVQDNGVYVHTNPYTNNAYTKNLSKIVGFGQAIRFDGPSIIRVCWEFEDTQKTKLERHPATNFGRDFAKLLKKMRNRMR